MCRAQADSTRPNCSVCDAPLCLCAMRARVVPLALALLNISHPDFAVIDQLSRLTHDADADVAQSAIMVRQAFWASADFP